MTSLSVVLPAHDEARTIERVVREVVGVVEALAPGDGEVIVVDDGSADDTPAILDRLAEELSVLTVVHQDNAGHGPALLTGFDLATGAWIGHLDTDDQIPAAELALLWPARVDADLVLGVRVVRHDPRHRLLLTRGVRALVRALAGQAVRDANVPCKLVSGELWAEARPALADDTFAPSVSLAVLAARRGRRIAEVPVEHRERPHGASSLKPVRLARALLLSTEQTLRLVAAERRRAGPSS